MRTSLTFTLCLLGLSRAIQVQPVQDQAAPAVASFISNDLNACFEGPAELAASALATKRVAPYGSIINASYIRNGVRCTDAGYKLIVGEDDCYPGLNLYKKWELGFFIYRMGKRSSLDAYGKRNQLDPKTVEKMVGCTCHGNSHLRSLYKGNCSNLESMAASWVYRNPLKNNELTCHEGRFESATRAATIMMSSQGDQIHPKKCAALGFPKAAESEAYSSFVSNDGHVCFDGPTEIAQNALALKKSSPYSLVFNGSAVRGTRCAESGYNFAVGKDDCYAGLQVATKANYTMMFYKLHKHNVLTAYSKHYKLPYAKVELMNACICHPKSSLRKQRAGECGNLDPMNVSWVHMNQETGARSCYQGPFESTTRAVVLLKNTGKVPVPQDVLNDHFAPTPCEEHLSEQQL